MTNPYAYTRRPRSADYVNGGSFDVRKGQRMFTLKHPNTNRTYKAPPDWNEERDGPCADLHCIHGEGMNIFHIALEPDQLAVLANGGSLRIAIQQEAMPVWSIEAVEWPNQKFDNEGNPVVDS